MMAKQDAGNRQKNYRHKRQHGYAISHVTPPSDPLVSRQKQCLDFEKSKSADELYHFSMALSVRSVRLRALEDGFGIDGDLDDVANDNSASLKRRVPTHAKVMAIDLGCGDKTSPRLGTFVYADLRARLIPIRRLPQTA